MRPLLLLLLLATPAYAGPKKLAKSIGHQLKQNFYSDFRGPYKWQHLASLGIIFAAVEADAITSCMIGGTEVGSARFVIGKHPSCAKTQFYLLGTTAVETTTFNWFAHSFKDSCDKEAADPNSRWNHTDAYTHSTGACFWGWEAANAGMVTAYKWNTIKGNIDVLGRK